MVKQRIPGMPVHRALCTNRTVQSKDSYYFLCAESSCTAIAVYSSLFVAVIYLYVYRADLT